MKQKEVFLESEGTKWFERNKDKLIVDKKELLISFLGMYNIKPKKVLELDCSNGYRLSYLTNKFNC